jgi:hypothetical protein
MEQGGDGVSLVSQMALGELGGGDLERWQWALKKRRNTTKCDFTTTGVAN